MRITAFLLPLLLLLPAFCEAAELVQASDLESGLHIVRRADAWHLMQTSAEPLLLPLPLDFQAYGIEALEKGWIVAGLLPGPEGTDLLVIRGLDDHIEVLPQPGGHFGAERANPTLLVEDGVLQGLAWIEGQRQQELIVKAARWEAGSWGDVEEVSGRGPGAQMALTGTVLPNGDWLLLWAGFDGEDDEIVSSLRSPDGWSVPRRVHSDNRSPDITPTVVATDWGALAAWSSFTDGHYRLRLARWRDGTWQTGPPSGGKGSLYPQAFRSFSGVQILHLSVIPEGWSLIEFDGRGLERGRRHTPQTTLDRPLLIESIPGSPTLRWMER